MQLMLGALCWTLLAGARSSTAQVTPAALPPSPPTETRFFHLSEIKRGQLGVAYTVFEGVTPEPMQVEILGVLKNSLGPGRDLILARLHGIKPEYTGVVAGMSGSPVYIDGRLAGALSYRIGQFSKEPIAGITPIESMLEVRDTRDTSSRTAPAAKAAIATEAGPMQAMETPLIFSGFSQATVDRFGERFRAMGLTPVAGLGGADSETTQPEPLIPGSAVSAVLVRGDLSISGTCTVTYVDPARLLACGHPITQNGAVSMPMTKATVVATLPSPLNAFKIINTTETVGSFTEDRASAILGRFGVDARMIPVTVEIADGPKSRSFHLEVLDDRQLTPSAMLTSIYQTLQSTNAAAAEQSYMLTGELSIAGQPTLKLRGMMAPTGFNTGAINAALYVNERFTKVYENPDEHPVVTAFKLHMEQLPARRTASLVSARASRVEVRPGDLIDIEVTVDPYEAEERVIRIPVKLPATLTPGAFRLVVSDGSLLDRLSSPAVPAAPHPIDLADTIAGMNRAHANDGIYVTLLEHTAQAVVDTGTLPGIPLSMANVFDPAKNDQQLQLSGESAAELGSATTGYAITGSHVLRLTVR